MPVPRITTSTDTIRSAVAATVYTRQHWGDDWVEREYLYCQSAEWCASPKVCSAQLVWHYGTGVQPGDVAFAAYDLLDIIDHWVKIVIPQTTPTDEEGQEDPADDLVWYGRIERVGRALTTAPKRQTFQCVGMECLLAHRVRDSRVQCNELPIDELFRVPWGLEFNPPDRARPHATDRPESIGNRTDSYSPEGVYVFAGPTVERLESAEQWTTHSIVEYLLMYHSPVDGMGFEPIEIALAPDIQDWCHLPLWDHPRVPSHNRTLKQLLDGLIDRRRLISYVVEVEEVDGGNDKVIIRPFTFIEWGIFLPWPGPGVHYLPQSNNKIAIDFEPAIDLREAVVETSAVQQFEQVRAVGQQIVFCATIRATEEEADTTIVAHWSEAQQTDYNEATSGEAGYDDLTRPEQQQRNADYRAREELTRVYSYFGCIARWPEDDKDVFTGSKWTSPILRWCYTENKLDPDTDRFFYRPMMRLERQLPLKVDWDYSVSPAVDNTPAGVTAEYLRPLVWFKLHDDLESTEDKYQLADRLGACADIEGTGDGAGRAFSCSVRVQDEAAGLVLKVQGVPQHSIATTDFDGGVEADEPIKIPEYEWRDELIATIAVKADCQVERKYPDVVDTVDPMRIKIIDASARAALIYLLPDTVVGLDPDGDLVTSPSKLCYIRDDRDLLDDAARTAFEWYGQERKTLTLTWRQVQNAGLFSVGDLVTEIGPESDPEPIRTVITSIKITFAQSATETHSMTIRTQWAELDVMEFI